MEQLLPKNLEKFDFEIEFNDENTNIQLPVYKNGKKSKANSFQCDAILRFGDSLTALAPDSLLFEKFDMPKNKIGNVLKDFIKEIRDLVLHEDIIVNEHTADQLLIWMALAEGRSVIQVGELSKMS